MSGFLGHKGHIVRLGLLFAAGLAAFLVARTLAVPKNFGQYGHFRPQALKDDASFPMSYAGRKACEDCHSDITDQRKGSKHERVGCEGCHGPLAKHAQDPSSLAPKKPDGRTTCLVCHLANATKPAGFPQVNPKDHGDGGLCTTCHKPHHPEVS